MADCVRGGQEMVMLYTKLADFLEKVADYR